MSAGLDFQPASAEEAAALDAADPLASLRQRFDLPDGVLYLDGNSLGAMPAAVPQRLERAIVEEWGKGLIGSWFEGGWWEAPRRVGDAVAEVLGCAKGQVVVGDSVSVQIFNLLTGAARLNPGRETILVDADAFPTDAYMAASVARMLGRRLRPVSMEALPVELDARGGEVAAVLASAVDFRSGRLWDVTELTRACHERGALALWDLCHAAGAVPIDLDAAGVDLAVGCTYKYLSGGPGSPAFAYVAARHQQELDLPLTGWHGHRRPFGFEAEYRPAADVRRARIGTPNMLSMLALEEALRVFDGVSRDAVRRKSVALGDFFLACLDAAAPEGVDCITPREGGRRGSHIALTHPRSEAMMARLVEGGVVCDYRPPNVLRFGYNPLYISFKDIYAVVGAIAAATGTAKEGSDGGD